MVCHWHTSTLLVGTWCIHLARTIVHMLCVWRLPALGCVESCSDQVFAGIPEHLGAARPAPCRQPPLQGCQLAVVLVHSVNALVHRHAAMNCARLAAQPARCRQPPLHGRQFADCIQHGVTDWCLLFTSLSYVRMWLLNLPCADSHRCRAEVLACYSAAVCFVPETAVASFACLFR
jgi:hypothetical protein